MPTTRSRKSKTLKKENLQSTSISPSSQSVTLPHAAVKTKNNKHVVKKRSPIKTNNQLATDRALGVKRLLGHFHKFYKSQTDAVKRTKMSISNDGLTRKERNYIICSCSQRSSKYKKLKALAFEAQKNRKVFRINGTCNALRDALVERGWVEQIPPAKMNLASKMWQKSPVHAHIIVSMKQGKFKPDKENRLPSYLNYAKHVVSAIYKYRPQLGCEGCHNIWIIKPANCSRGRGIRLASKLSVLTELVNKGKYVFQKYIEESMLIHDTKFDVRQYYLVTSLMPLEIWMYQDCYLKFSSQKYNLKNFHESIHLTNNAVQRKYRNCNNRHPELPPHNMWSLATFKEYLEKTGKGDIWDSTIYPGMKKSIIGIMLSCQDSSVSWKNRFEIYGCDFILDKNCKPWLIEINSGPDLNPTTDVTAEICPMVLSDLVRVVIDRAEDPSACTGKFECIYRQSISARPFVRTDKLVIQGNALPSNYFSRGVTEAIKVNSTEKINSGKTKKKKSKYSRKSNSKNTKLDDFVEHPGDSVIRIMRQNDHKSTFSLNSSASSKNFRQISVNNVKSSSDMKADVQKSIQDFYFGKLDNDDVSCEKGRDENTKHDEPNKKNAKKSIPKKSSTQIISQETGGVSQIPVMDLNTVDSCEMELSSLESVTALALPSCAVKENNVNGAKTDTGVKKLSDQIIEASKDIFSFLDKKHNEYVADSIIP
ncbi:tubulin-tyrosine ligase family domain-containing protein [Phthorimaea operculella]|nr:tubulin-tyrosine ligase family domain-containing protein [Phthorimaea operculella]